VLLKEADLEFCIIDLVFIFAFLTIVLNYINDEVCNEFELC